MNLRRELRLKRTLRNLRTWAPPISIGVIIGVGALTLVDRLSEPAEATRPALVMQHAPQPTVRAAQPEAPAYMQQASAAGTARAAQPDLPPYLQRASAGSSFGNCTEARAAGRPSIRSGEAGYAPHLDRDNDGIACEPYYGR